MGHIHTGEGEYDHTASAYIIRTDGDEPRGMLHVHKLLGRLLQPGGHIELTENPWQAITHEITEETGYTLDQLQVLQPEQRFVVPTNDAVIHPYPVIQNSHVFGMGGSHYHTDTAYAFVTDQLPVQKVAEGESEDIHWLTATELDDLPNESIYSNARQIAVYVLRDILNVWQPVDTTEFSIKHPPIPEA